MEVKSRKKSNLYDSIKKDNRCDDTVCGKKDELSLLAVLGIVSLSLVYQFSDLIVDGLRYYLVQNVHSMKCLLKQ